MRLSRDDGAGESMSIENQRILLQRYVNECGGIIIDEYVDDGWSGTDFERPAIKRLLQDAQAGKVDTIIVKDLSRFGRNYIQVGQYIDYIFPAYGIRFIALNDNVDTADKNSSGMDMMPIMNVFNEWHAANTSKKIRAVLEAKQRSGIYTSWNYPYGYRAGTDANRTAVIDEDAAKIVRRIYDLRLQGNSARIIARILTDEGIPNPATHFTKLSGDKSQRRCSPHWVPKTVMEILKNPTYIGSVTQHKTTSVSYKNHTVVKIPENERIVKEYAHRAIISRDIWNKVQALNNSSSKGRADKGNIVHALSGLLVCPDCGKKLKLSSYKGKNSIHYYICRTYCDLGKKYCPSHRISESVLEELVLRDIQSMLPSVEINEEKLKEQYLRERAKRNTGSKFANERQLIAHKNRLAELDILIQSAFEAKVLGSMPENVCINLCTKYQAEKEAVEREIGKIEQKLVVIDDEKEAAEYLNKLRRYAACQTLTREICLELISFIEVGEKAQGERAIQIYYKFKMSNIHAP